MKISKKKDFGNIIIKNSSRILNEGNGKCKGIFYCGRKYTNAKGCACGNCNGFCGPDYGCPCPDCYYTLSYILYSTGKMTCPKCNKTLLRINLFNLKNIVQKKRGWSNVNFSCDICEKNYDKELYAPLLHCFNCDYDMCPECAFSRVSSFKEKVPKLLPGNGIGTGLIFCAKNYTNNGFCLCGECDGNCGPDNGCQCPLCESILNYNLYLHFLNTFKCKCKNTFVKTTIGLLKFIQNKYNSNSSFKCLLCSTNKYIDNFASIYHCYTCKQSICQGCAYLKAGIYVANVNALDLPKPPIFLDNMETTIREKIKRKTIEDCVICRQKNIKFIKNKRKGEEINIYLKTLIGRIYTIKIDNAEPVSKIKEELGKLDNQYRTYNTILLFKNKILDNDDFIDDLKIENGNLLNVILKENF